VLFLELIRELLRRHAAFLHSRFSAADRESHAAQSE
jgi:hypothetical protein